MSKFREDMAWAAGLFEGEGSIVWTSVPPRNNTKKRHYRCQLSLHSTDEDVVRRFHKVIGIGVVNGPYNYSTKKTKRKPSWYWAVGSHERVQAAIAMMWPWLCSRRRERAKEVLALELLERPAGSYRRDAAGRYYREGR